MNILFFLRHYPPPYDGGAYNYNANLVKHLHESGAHVTVLTHKDAEQMVSATINIIPCKYIKTGRYHYEKRFEKFFDILKSSFFLRRIITKGNFNWIISDAGYIQNLIVFLSTFITKNKVVGINFSEEISAIQKSTMLRAKLQRWLLKQHACNIVISKSTEKMIKYFGITTPIILIYPCIDETPALEKTMERKKLNKKYSIKETDFVVGFLGRIILRKGIENLILAISDLREDGFGISILIAGQGRDEYVIKKLIHEKNCQDYCKMVGLLPDEEKTSFYSGIDIYAMPNYDEPQTGDSEGFGIVFLEAAQQGTPVIGGIDGGVPEALSDGYNGFNVDGENIDAIKDVIEKYIVDISLRASHGENGKTWVKNFYWINQIEPFINFLKTNEIN